MRRTTLLAASCAGCVAGVALGRKWPFAPNPTWLLLAPATLIVYKRVRKIFYVAWAVSGLSLGWWRGAAARQKLIRYEDLYRQNVTVEVEALTDGVYAINGNLGFDAKVQQVIQPQTPNLTGTLIIEARGLPGVFRGDQVEVSGRMYPAGGSKQGSIKFASARLVDRQRSWVENIRLRFGAAMQTALPEPQASFGLGILVGQRSTLPDKITDNLSIVGLTHIIAVSGYNLTIIIQFVGKRLGRRSKYQTIVLSLGLMATFILITGFSASIVRAGLVSCLSLGAWYYGRTFKPLLLLLIPAAITALWNPVYVWSDLGWYLSFLAFYGVLVLAPLITKLWWKDRSPPMLIGLIIETSSAQAMTVPLVMYIFKEVSLIALLSNILVVPFVPLVMLLALIAGVGGMLTVQVAGWLAWPAKFLMSYMLEVVEVLADIPYAKVPWSMSWLAMIVSYALIAFACCLISFKIKPQYGKITDENQ